MRGPRYTVNVTAKIEGTTDIKPKGLNFKPEYQKTQTSIIIPSPTGKMHGPRRMAIGCQYFDKTLADINMLGLQDRPIKEVVLIAWRIKNLGRFHNRTIRPFAKMGITVPEIQWEDTSAEIHITMRNGLGHDIAPLVEMLYRACFRANRFMLPGMGQHTLFNYLQALGLYIDMDQGDTSAESIIAWSKLREKVFRPEYKAWLAKSKSKS